MRYNRKPFDFFDLQTFFTLSRNRFNEYGNAFIAFLNNNKTLFPESEQEHYFLTTIYRYLNKIKESIDKEVADITKQQGDITEEKIKEVVEKEIEDFYNRLHAIEDIPDVSSDFVDITTKKYKDNIIKAIDSIFEKLPISDQCHEKLENFCVTLFIKGFKDPNYSGIVIAGFGQDETFPSMVSYNLFGITNGRLKYNKPVAR